MNMSSEGGLGYLPSKRLEAYNKAFTKLDKKIARKVLRVLKSCK